MKVSMIAAAGCVAAMMAATGASASVLHTPSASGHSSWTETKGWGSEHGWWFKERGHRYHGVFVEKPIKTKDDKPKGGNGHAGGGHGNGNGHAGNNGGGHGVEEVPGVPVPAAGLLLVAGLGGLAALRRKR